jgi:hypothetical protein
MFRPKLYFCTILFTAVTATLSGTFSGTEAGQKNDKKNTKKGMNASPTDLPKAPLLDVQAVLMDTDPRDPVLGGPSRRFRVELSKAKKYQIDLMSKAFDSFLRLEDQEGKELARDDDSGGMLNARIIFSPPVDGYYQIIATSLDKRPGAYQFRVQEYTVPPPTVLALDKGIATVKDRLVATDVPDSVRSGCFSKVYKVKMLAGNKYQIDMKSQELDAYLRLENSSGNRLAEDDDSGGDLNARIIFNCARDDEYRVIATTFRMRDFGGFVLQVQEK